MDKPELYEVLKKLDENLQLPTRLHVRGGAACMLHGEEYRMTLDIDVIPGESRYEKTDLSQACEKAGILLDPTEFEELEGNKPYLQLLPEESLCLPRPKPNSAKQCWEGKKLEMSTPPAADLIISKLKRSDPVDLQDIAFLLMKFETTMSELKEAFSRLPSHFRKDVILVENFENTLRDFFPQEPRKSCQKSPKKEKLHTALELEPAYS